VQELGRDCGDHAGVDYHRNANRKRLLNATDAGLIGCWQNPAICGTIECHDKLRDQPVTVELDTFISVWEKIASELRATTARNPSSIVCFHHTRSFGEGPRRSSISSVPASWS
jgi:hypothetical protein